MLRYSIESAFMTSEIRLLV